MMLAVYWGNRRLAAELGPQADRRKRPSERQALRRTHTPWLGTTQLPHARLSSAILNAGHSNSQLECMNVWLVTTGDFRPWNDRYVDGIGLSALILPKWQHSEDWD
jgi:hypothetical protein